MLLESLRTEVRDTYRNMFNENVIRGTQGNVSAIDRGSELIAITPSGVACDAMSAEDIAVVDKNGNLVEGSCKPTSELPMHTYMYRNSSEIGAVVHSHAPYATVFALIHEPIPVVMIEAAGPIGSTVKVAPFRTPGTEDLGQIALETMGGDAAVLLANHGLLTVGATLGLAYEATIACEDTARLVIMARSMNAEPIPLDDDFVRDFRKMFVKWYLSKHPA